MINQGVAKLSCWDVELMDLKACCFCA